MKKLLILFVSVFCMAACNVDPVETEFNDEQLLVMDATITVDGCKVTTFNFINAGKIEVRNDPDFIYVKILATGDYDLVQTNLHIAADVFGFPINKNGSINTNKMDHSISLPSGSKEYTYKFPINSFGATFTVGAYSIFQLGKKQTKLWAGDQLGRDWLYFEYSLNKHPFYAGSDKSREISLSEASAAESWDEVRKLFANMLDPGVPRGWRDGTYEPSIWDIIYRFNDPILGGVGEYTTTYTLGSGECTDSVELTLYVVPDSI